MVDWPATISLIERRKQMNTKFKILLIGAIAVGLYVPITAFAQKSGGGVVGEARMHPGTWGQRTSRSYTRSRPMYRSESPAIVRRESAPPAVAQAPTERRSFSYEPTAPAESRVIESSHGCGGVVVREKPAPETAQRTTDGERRFSYEPSTEPSSAPPVIRTESAPRMQSMRRSRSSDRPVYLLPKSDPRRYSGRL
jgi:hypothetical protein